MRAKQILGLNDSLELKKLKVMGYFLKRNKKPMDEIETNKLIDQIFTSMEKELQNQKISVKTYLQGYFEGQKIRRKNNLTVIKGDKQKWEQIFYKYRKNLL